MNQSLHSRSLFLALLIASVIGASVEAQMQQEDATVAPNGPEELMVFDEVTNEDKLRAHITPKDEDCKFVPGTSDIIAVTGSDMLTWQNITDTESVQDFDTVGVEPDENVAVRFKGEMGCPGGGGGGVDNPPEWKVLVGDVKISPVDYVLCGQTIAVGLRVAPDDLPAKAVVTVSIETTAQGGAAMFIVNGQEQTTVTLSSGQSSVQLKGTKASAVVDDVILKAKVAGKTVSTEKLHVIGVKEVYWETYAPDTPPQGWTANTPIDDHPAIPANGGKRIFPDKTSPSDSFSAQRKKVYLKAKLTPAIAGINVYFRVWDVDDPSSSSSPVDGNDTGGAATGNDNRPSGESSQDFSVASQTVGNDAIARVEFAVSMRPGNNFKAFAATFADLRNAVTLSMADGHDTLPACVEDSPMLTVWRRLHVEIDSMGTITGNTESGAIEALTPSGTAVWITIPDVSNFWVEADDHFDNGEITVTIGGTPTAMKVQDFDSQSVIPDLTNSDRILVVSTPGLAVSQQFVLEDDDGANLPYSPTGEPPVALPRQLDTSKMPSYYRKAYVEPILDPYKSAPYYDANVGFVLNQSSDSSGGSKANEQKDLTSADDFWAVKLVAAFQPEVEEDGDPDAEHGTSVTMGLTWDPLFGRPDGSLIYLETVRDHAFGTTPTRQEYEQERGCVHESGHQFGLDHSDGYNGTQANPDDDYIMTDVFDETSMPPNREFSPASLDKIRDIDYPHK